MAGVLFEDIFNVKDIDPEGKKFDRGEFVSRFTRRYRRALPGIRARGVIHAVNKPSERIGLLDLADKCR